MSDLWVNIRFGTRHLQIGPSTFRVTQNSYFVDNPPDKVFEVFTFRPFV